jgi:hypothetical protein
MTHIAKKRVRQLFELMQDGKERTSPVAAREMNWSHNELCRAMKQLYDAGDVHIIDWHIPKTGGYVAVYIVGSGRDKAKPVQPSNRERGRLQAMREETERRRIEAIKLEAFVPFRDPLTAAFYGEYQREAA